MYQLFDRPVKVGGVISNSFRLYGASFKKTLIPTIVLTIFMALQAFYIHIFTAKATAAAKAMKTVHDQVAVHVVPTNAPHLSQLFPQFGMTMLISLIGGLLGVLLFAWIVRRIVMVSRNETDSLGSSFVFALKKWPWLFLIAAVNLLLFVIGCVLFVVPGIYVVIPLIFVSYFIVADEEKFSASYEKSFKIVWGRWWHSLGTLLLFAIMAAIPMIACVVILTILSILLHWSQVTMDWTTLGILQVYHLFLFPWAYAFLFVLFTNLKLQRKRKQQIEAFEKTL